jgi:RimJ/RimL family protein N-acetyltransferase
MLPSLSAFTAIYNVNNAEHTCFTGILIFEDNNRGKGYGHWAKLLHLKYAFENLHMAKVYSKVRSDHEAVIKWLRKLGYEDAKAHPAHSADTLVFLLTKEGWAQHPNRRPGA